MQLIDGIRDVHDPSGPVIAGDGDRAVIRCKVELARRLDRYRKEHQQCEFEKITQDKPMR